MIDISIDCDAFFIYKVSDWEKIRREHRLIGELSENTHSTPVLPLKLLPEECVLLLKKGIARLVKSDYKVPDKNERAKYVGHLKMLLEGEQKVYKNVRKEELKSIIDKIVAGKRKKGDTRTKEEIFEDELKKSSDINEDVMIWPIFTADSNNTFNTKTHIEVPVKLVEKFTTPTKTAVFEDLWNRGYYITSGTKFGGDFLVYKGDPILFHAFYIVRCVEDINENIYSSEIVAFGRLGTCVKKSAVLASLVNNSVTYITLKWIDAT